MYSGTVRLAFIGETCMKERNVNPVKKVILSALAALMALCVLFGIFALSGRGNATLVVGAENTPSETPTETPQEQAVAAFQRYYKLFMGTEYAEETAGAYAKYVTDLKGAEASELNGILKAAIGQFFGIWQGEATSVYNVAQAQNKLIDEKIGALKDGEYATDLDDDLQKAIDEIDLRIYKNEKLQELGEAYGVLSTTSMPDFMDDLNQCNTQAGSDIEAVQRGTGTLAAAQKTIDDILEQAKIDFRTHEIVGIASQEYYDSYKAVKGAASGDTVPEAVTSKLAELKDAVDAAVDNEYGEDATRYALVVAWNENVAAAVKALLDSSLIRVDGVLMDSQETYRLVLNAKREVAIALNNAETGKLADFSAVASDAMSDLTAQRSAEKNAAKGKMNDTAAALKGDKTYSEAIASYLESAQTAAEEEIDGAYYNVYSLIVDRFIGKAAFLDALAQFQAKVTANGGNVDFDDEIAPALAAIGEADNADGVIWVKDRALLDVEKRCASAFLEALVSDGSQEVKGLLAGADGYAAKLENAKSAEAVGLLVDEAVVAIRSGKFLDENSVLRKAFSAVGADDKAALETAKTAFSAADEEIKAYLDGASAYTSFEKEIEDRSRKADYEAERARVIGEIGILININNVNAVVTALQAQRDAVQATDYAPHTDDATREEYLGDRKAALGAILAKAQHVSDGAEALEERLAQYEEKLQAYLASGDYSDLQKQEMQRKADEYLSSVAEVLAEAVDEATAERVLDELFAQAESELTDAPVCEVTASGVAPENGDYAEGYDGNALWGTVTNESGIEKGTVLTVEKKDNASLDVEAAAKNGKLKAAAGSGLTKSEMEELVDNRAVVATLDISLAKGSVKLDKFTGNYVVTVLLPAELRDQALVVVCAGENGDVEVFDAQISEDGKYLTFTTDHFSEFVLLGEGDVTDVWWLVITLTAVVAVELFILLAVLLKKGSRKKGTAASVLPLGLLALVFPADIAFCIILGVAAAGLAVGIFFAVRAKK